MGKCLPIRSQLFDPPGLIHSCTGTPMVQFFAALLIVFLLSGIAVTIRRGLNEIIRGLESIDQRLANLERMSGTDSER